MCNFPNIFSESIKQKMEYFEETLKIRDTEIGGLKNDLCNRDGYLQSLQLKIEDLKRIIERTDVDLKKMKDLEDENCNLSTAKKYNEARIKDLEEQLLKERDNKNDSINNNLEAFLENIEERVGAICEKHDGDNLKDPRKFMDDLRKSYISKSEFDLKLERLKKQLVDLNSKYVEQLEVNKELRGNTGRFDEERSQLRSELERLAREREDLRQSMRDVRAVLAAKEAELEQAARRVAELAAAERCGDCVVLRQEIDLYGALLRGKTPGLEMTSSTSSSSSSSSGEGGGQTKSVSSYKVTARSAASLATRSSYHSLGKGATDM